eukprot:5257536-Pyramimonas_sp.AAC.1
MYAGGDQVWAPVQPRETDSVYNPHSDWNEMAAALMEEPHLEKLYEQLRGDSARPPPARTR